MRLENVVPRILAVSENWITESSNLTEEKLDIVFKRCDVPKRMASDLVGLSSMPFSQNQTGMALKHDWSVLISLL